MCTCIEFKSKDFYFGRNLDLEYNFGEKVVIAPRNYEFKLKNNTIFNLKYAIIGMATVVDNYPLYADATNEKGLCIAGLECVSEEETISQFFHILDSVSMIKGTVVTKENKLDMTTYSSCINSTKGIYYFKTYYNNQINAVSFNEKNMNSDELEIYELPVKQSINNLN